MKIFRKTLITTLTLFILTSVLFSPVAGLQPSSGLRAPAGAEVRPGGELQVEVGDPVIPTETIALRDAPRYTPEPTLDREVNPRMSTNPDFDPRREGVGGIDPLLALQAAVQPAAPSAFTTPILNYEGQGFSFVNPPDTVGEIGPNHYIQMINGGGSSLVIYDKAGNIVSGPTILHTLGSGACASGAGDPVVLYDQLADRWLLSEFADTGNHLCVYVSKTADPTGAYWNYDFATPNFPDYPKYAVWPDAYYVTTNEDGGPAAYALDRASMLTGAAATSQRFTAPGLSGFGFQALTPGDWDGATPPAAGAPALLMRHVDTEAHGPGGMPAQDILEMWQLDIDWVTPANSTFTQMPDILVSEFDSDLCGLSSTNCFPQPGSGTTLDPVREVIMWRLQYRNFGTHETLVGSFVVDVGGTDHGGIRWFELRRSGGAWSLYQEGTYAPDASSRWMSSIAMDGGGNIALGYNVTDAASVFPSLRYVGRLASDPLGTMTSGEAVLAAGSAANGSNRYGDYTSMNVDPSDDCTFWYTGEYNPASNWSTRIGSFKFDTCSGGGGADPDFSLQLTPAALQICAPDILTSTLLVSVVNGFSQDVTLSDSGVPAGVTTSFTGNPVTPPGTTGYVVDVSAGAADGAYDLVLSGAAVTLTHQITVPLLINSSALSATVLTSPANNALNQPLDNITFQWDAVSGAASYRLQVDNNADFSSPLADVSNIAATSYLLAGPLSSSTTYYWRVAAVGGCGETFSSAFSFSTLSQVGFCGVGSTPVTLYTTDFEGGEDGWTHDGITDTWVLTGTRTHSGVQAFHASDVASVSDQRLVSPPVALPNDVSDLTLQFWNHQTIESAAGGCYDGGILEISTDGGISWTQVISGLLTDPYDGVIDAGFGNPLGGLNGWCGEPQDWLNSMVDLNDYAGQSVNFRFSLGTDTAGEREGWYIDDVTVLGCETIPMSYTLSANTAGSGSVTIAPDQALYDLNDVVTLTAVADLGWMFDGWNGDLSGTTNPQTIVMDASKVVTATFIPRTYTLDITTSGQGTVSLDPDQTSYQYGDTVTLTAEAALGWVFVGWEGALAGTTNPQTITIESDLSIVAVFEQEAPTGRMVYLPVINR